MDGEFGDDRQPCARYSQRQTRMPTALCSITVSRLPMKTRMGSRGYPNLPPSYRQVGGQWRTIVYNAPRISRRKRQCWTVLYTTNTTGNVVPRKGLWVRVPCPPLLHEAVDVTR